MQSQESALVARIQDSWSKKLMQIIRHILTLETNQVFYYFYLIETVHTGLAGGKLIEKLFYYIDWKTIYFSWYVQGC